jgi:glycosyltransferase involved in cell wall biosynthesis
MKILLANSTCKVGGVSSFMLALRSALLSQGHECELFFFERGTMEAHLPAGCPVRFGSLADCLELVDRGRFAVVHANNVDWTTGISAVRSIGARLIVTAHKSREGAWTYGWTRRNCDLFTAVSRGVAARLQPFTDLPIHVVYNGIDLSRFSRREPVAAASSATPIVAWIGRSGSPLKGFEKLAAIAPHLRSGGARVWVIDQHGPAQARKAYPAAAAALAPWVDRWDSVEFGLMPDLYGDVAASGGCVLSTSVAEGLPLALLEAQASGCLAIASDVPGNEEAVLPRHGGLRYPLAADGRAIAGLVLAALADREQVRARQQAAAAHVRGRFSIERMAREYADLYQGEVDVPRRAWRERVRGTLRLSPLHWRGYVEHRLGVGYAQLNASLALTAAGHSRLAASAGLAAMRTSPTMFFRPARLAHLLRLLRRNGVNHQQRLVVGGHDAGAVPRVEDLR